MPTAIKIALERNLELKAKSEELGIAEGRVIKSNLFLQNNPELEADMANKRLKKPEEGFNKNLFQPGVSLSQEFEIGGQPGYRREAARRNLGKVGFEVSDFGRSLRFRITELFLKLLNGKAKINQAEQVVDLKNRLHEASKDRLAAGDIPGVQLAIAEFELNRAKSELISLQREYEEILSRLRTDLVLEKEESVEPVGDLTRAPLAASLDELFKSALEKRPDLAALEQEKKVAEAEELLTRAERIPNIKFGMFYEKDDKDNVVGGKISIPLPFFDRKQGERREALARKSIANLNYIQRRQALEKEVRAAFTRFKLAERDVSYYPEGAMKKFDESLELYQRAYQEGAIDLADAIVFQNQVIEARLKFIDTLTVYNLSLAELKFQAGIE
ncbi:MAG: TolC family protein [Deltaproteobacteria bacterium]|nr:TolC family protein [Deltaproteobacteria bacterium]